MFIYWSIGDIPKKPCWLIMRVILNILHFEALIIVVWDSNLGPFNLEAPSLPSELPCFGNFWYCYVPIYARHKILK